MHSFRNKFLLSTYTVWGAVLGHEYTAVCETGMVPAFTEMTIHEGDRQDLNTPETNVPLRCDYCYEGHEHED